QQRRLSRNRLHGAVWQGKDSEARRASDRDHLRRNRVPFGGGVEEGRRGKRNKYRDHRSAQLESVRLGDDFSFSSKDRKSARSLRGLRVVGLRRGDRGADSG